MTIILDRKSANTQKSRVSVIVLDIENIGSGQLSSLPVSRSTVEVNMHVPFRSAGGGVPDEINKTDEMKLPDETAGDEVVVEV